MVICLIVVAIVTLSSWTASVKAQSTLPAPVYPVVHDKAWYQERFTFTWVDDDNVSHEANIVDPATNPHHIVALLRYAYTNPDVPGLLYAIPDSAGMDNIYPYILDQSQINRSEVWFDFNTFERSVNWSQRQSEYFNEIPWRCNNLSTLIDYERHVSETNFTGDVDPNVDPDRYNAENRLNAGTNGQGAWLLGEALSGQKVQQPKVHGLTVFLVKMRDDFSYTKNEETGKVTSDYTCGSSSSGSTRLECGCPSKVLEAISREIEEVKLITNSIRIDDDESKTSRNSGTLFSIDEKNLNRFYFLAKGAPRQSVKMPTKPLFEEFSPIGSLDNGWQMDFYNELMAGKVYTMQHDCSSVPEQAHAFSMHGLAPDATTHRDVSGMAFWVPDYRMDYWLWKWCDDSSTPYYGYTPDPDRKIREGLGRDLFKGYVGKSNGAEIESTRVYRVLRYFNYNPLHAPSLALYTCQLKADAQPYNTEQHTYNVTLDWYTTVSQIASNSNSIPEDFEVYTVVNGVRSDEPLFSFTYGQPDYCTVNNMAANLSNGSAPSSQSRTYEKIYVVPQYEDHGYWITYQVFARVHKSDGTEVFTPVYSNLDRVWIPPYKNQENIKLYLEVNSSSAYSHENEVNRYVNTIMINNDPVNPLKIGDVFARPNSQGWNPETNKFENPPQGASWQYADNNLGSEILIYRYDTAYPEDKTQVARVYFNNILESDGRIRFAVGRDNQAESAQEGEYVYTNDNLDAMGDHSARPWWQSCDANYNVESDFPFNNNNGYALGTNPKQDPNYRYTKGLMVTDVFEVSTASNEHPSQYGYIAKFHKYSNPNAANYGFNNVTYISNPITAEVYKSIGESSEVNFTKDEVDNGDKQHELELGYKAGLTVNNMLYLPEIEQYDIFSRTLANEQHYFDQVNSFAKRDTRNNYIVYVQGKKEYEPEQYQSAVTIPDKGRQVTNMDAMYYVPVITAKLPDRAVWMANGDDVAWKSSTYGSDYHGTANTLVWLEKDTEHKLYETYLKAYLGLGENEEPTEEQLCNGSDIEHAETASGQHYYGHFMQVKSEMSPNLEVYGVRIWRVRSKDDKGTPEDVLVKEWFKGQDMDLSSSMPQPGYFVVSNASDGTINVALKDIYKGPAPATLSSDVSYQPTYIVHFYGRMKPTTASMLKAGTDDQAKVYYASERKYLPTIPNEIPTGIGSTMHAKHVVNVKYFDTMGRMSDSPFKGINIVETHYDDGSTTTTKLVK